MCSAGRDTFKILPNLNVYPCEYLVGQEKFCIGNISKGIDTDRSIRLAYELYDVDTQKCRECHIKDYCYQMKCGYSNYVTTGKINVPCDQDCKLEKMYYPIVESILFHLADNKYYGLKYYKDYIEKNKLKLSFVGEKVFEQLGTGD